MIWWAVPALVFALLALLTATAPTAPGAWFDRALHVFGIGGVSARSTAFSLWLVSAAVAGAAGAALHYFTTLSDLLVALDGAGLGLAVAFTLLWLATRKGQRGAGIND